jgi:DNA-binding beta-propeller fold protein YncE
MLPPATTATITATGAVRASNVVTITTAAPHDFVVNQLILVSGVTDPSFNGTFLVASVPSTTTFTYNQAAANAMSGSGMVTSTAVRVKATAVADSTATATAIVSIDSGITVQVTPLSGTVGTSETLQFLATITGSTNQNVNWFVNGIAGGNSTVGTISASGLFTAPATPPNVSMATITATGAVRSNNVVTITTTAAHNFVVAQVVTIAGVTDTSFNGTFAINSVPSTTTFTYIQAAPNAMSGNGTATSSSIPVTIRAVAEADSSRGANASVLVVTATDPTLASISPTSTGEGAVFEDVFLTGTNFIATTEVLVNGMVLAPGQTVLATSSLIRARIPADLLVTPGMLSIAVRRQGGMPTAAQTFTVTTVRPAVVGASPDSAPQNGPNFDFNVNGGFFGTNVSPRVTFEYNGGTRAANVSTANVARQASITIGGADLADAGLFAVGVRSATDPTLFSATNLAVQPSAGPAMPSTIMVGMLPSSIAVNTATGVAVVANRGSNSLTLINIGDGSMAPTPGATIAVGMVGTSPTGVAVDEVRNLAVVANNSPGMPSGTVSIVDLAAQMQIFEITTNIGAAPFSVGVNSQTGLAVVVYQNSNRADIIDLTLNPPAVVSTATVSTGGSGQAGPQVAIEPRLDWAVVTPGGAGTLTIVSLSRRNVAAIAAAPAGATRNGGISTITTATAHALQNGQVVLIQGVADASFNGIFTVTAVPTSTSFTYTNAGPNATSGGGTITSTPPVATVGLGPSTRGVAINTTAQRVLLTDPTGSSLSLFNLFDQVVATVPLAEIGAVAAAFNPFTDIAVSVNANLNQASIIDPRTASRCPMCTVPVGAGARAVAIDPGTNQAFVVNETDGTVSAFAMSTTAIRSLHVSSIVLPLARQVSPGITLASAVDLPLTILGKGFVGGSVVRLDGTSLVPTMVTDRMIAVTVPAAMLAGPRRYVVDVLNPSGMNPQSNVLDLTVALPVDLTSATCMNPVPAAVAIDGDRDMAFVANSNCDEVAMLDLNAGTVTGTIAVGDNPQGVAVSPRLGRLVVTNRSANTASVIDLTAMTPTVSTVTTGAEPLGAAINESTGQVVVANATAGTLTVFDVTNSSLVGTVTADARPVAVAIDPSRNRAVIAHAAQNNAAVMDIGTLTIVFRSSAVQLPTAAAFDAASGQFVVNSSLGNQLLFINSNTLQVTAARSGINPTSLALNHRTSAMVTVNTASGTISVVDSLQNRIRSVLTLSLGPQFAIAIHPRSNLAALVDTTNNRILLMPLPR